ncbi:hypothetical protein J2J97_32065 (plasmid) [Rhizobium bangladeshense]|uniref:hypothetical protein n=1 Tax=Rhizobium bangladeshense TaxID=1138189 RepID=UPI001A9999AC|nr:hypothetical protein [Rhizobium bangladeshense]QSY98543.1 hypothetical protein J2J97_32065 [Rhizobium bangladeshense]
MSRALQIIDEEVAQEASLRQELMALEKHELVALLEESTAAEIAARRMTERLLQRVAAAEDIGKAIERRAVLAIQQTEEEAWNAATGGTTHAIEFVSAMLPDIVANLLARSGKERVALARFQVDSMVTAFNRMAIDPFDAARDGCEDTIAQHFYIAYQLASRPAPTGKYSQKWYELGRALATQT